MSDQHPCDKPLFDKKLSDKHLHVDFCMIGGGISGLWLLNRLRAKGYRVLLLEQHHIGGTQTLAAQGIIHSGIKYSLKGSGISPATKAISAMPARWHRMFQGIPDTDDPDFSQYPHLILSSAYYLWIRNCLPGVSGFFAERKLHSRLHLLHPQRNIRQVIGAQTPQVPKLFTNKPIIPRWRGRLYELDREMVLDIPALIRILAKPCISNIFHTKNSTLSLHRKKQRPQDAYVLSVRNTSGSCCHISAQKFILTAGSGTESLLKQAGIDSIRMQRRPLHMLMVKHPDLTHAAFMHVVGWSDKPMLTITSHHLPPDHYIWYLGGNLAEQGVNWTQSALIKRGKKLLSSYFHMNWDAAVWDSLRVTRAEPAQNQEAKQPALRPDRAYHQSVANLMVCWPTKLTLVPTLADQILAGLPATAPSVTDLIQFEQGLASALNLPHPEFGSAPWQKAVWRSCP